MRTSCWSLIYPATPRDGSGSTSLAAHGWRQISEAVVQDPGPPDLITQRVNALRISIPIRAPYRRYSPFQHGHISQEECVKKPRANAGLSLLLTEAGA